ncbi:uncharacterized protein LOC116578871 [Mustela erminea]|uniref:uncharacterized protein LOC116578871 n=1 Tax=Mustela erminea TaxID=36723 RepID=UPI0013874DF8|nr:uncharacterized protein LOC116578871 [Mustela erminea]
MQVTLCATKKKKKSGTTVSLWDLNPGTGEAPRLVLVLVLALFAPGTGPHVPTRPEVARAPWRAFPSQSKATPLERRRRPGPPGRPGHAPLRDGKEIKRRSVCGVRDESSRTSEHVRQKQCAFLQHKISSPKTASDCRKPGSVPKWQKSVPQTQPSEAALSALVSRPGRLKDENTHHAFQRMGILTPATAWTDLEDTVLGEIRPSQKDKDCPVLLTRASQTCRIPPDSGTDWGPGAGVGRRGG